MPYKINTLSHLRSPVADYNHDGWLDYPLMTTTDSYVNQIVMLMGSAHGLKVGSVKSAPCCNLVDAIVTADFNRDGNPDVALEYPSPGASTAVLFGRGDGTFQNPRDYATDGPGFGMQVADLNGDGAPDLLTSAAISMLNDGHGYFKAPLITQTGGPGRALSVSVAKADFNRDRIEDVALLAYSGDTNIVRVFNGTGRGYYDAGKTYPVGAATDLICGGDVNGDGIPDIVVVSPDSSSGGSYPYDISVLLGHKGGGFAAAKNAKIFPRKTSATYSRNVYLIDMNDDGKPDLVGEWGVSLGNGDGTFRRPVSFPSGTSNIRGLAVADFNRDGHPDVVVVKEIPNKLPSRLLVLINNGRGYLHLPHTIVVQQAITGIAAADMRGNRKIDLLYTYAPVDSGSPFGGPGTLAIALGNGNGTFLASHRVHRCDDLRVSPFDRYRRFRSGWRSGRGDCGLRIGT